MSGVSDPHPANLAKSYRAGWVHGASVKAMDKRFLEHPNLEMKAEYERGYKDGTEARKAAMDAAYTRLGYTPNILRTALDERAVDCPEVELNFLLRSDRD